MRRLLLATGLVLGLTASASADFLDGKAAVERGDHATALEVWRQCAGHGDAECQNGLGTLYDQGSGVAQDYAESIRWYRRAAEQGLAMAQANMGGMYHQGRGVHKTTRSP